MILPEEPVFIAVRLPNNRANQTARCRTAFVVHGVHNGIGTSLTSLSLCCIVQEHNKRTKRNCLYDSLYVPDEV